MDSHEPSARGISKRYKRVTLEEIEKLVSQGYYVVLKCDVDSDKQLYPCRDSEKRNNLEYPVRDSGQLEYATGRFTTWLRTNEVKDALAKKHIVKCYEVLISSSEPEHGKKWRKLTKEVFDRYRKVCMRCGDVQSTLQVDHIIPWSHNPFLRYDIDNLQVLCIHCHKWKTKQNKALDFRATKN